MSGSKTLFASSTQLDVATRHPMECPDLSGLSWEDSMARVASFLESLRKIHSVPTSIDTSIPTLPNWLQYFSVLPPLPLLSTTCIQLPSTSIPSHRLLKLATSPVSLKNLEEALEYFCIYHLRACVDQFFSSWYRASRYGSYDEGVKYWTSLGRRGHQSVREHWKRILKLIKEEHEKEKQLGMIEGVKLPNRRVGRNM